MKIMPVMGTRPEAIKLAPVIKEMETQEEEGILEEGKLSKYRQRDSRSVEPVGVR